MTFGDLKRILRAALDEASRAQSDAVRETRAAEKAAVAKFNRDKAKRDAALKKRIAKQQRVFDRIFNGRPRRAPRPAGGGV